MDDLRLAVSSKLEHSFSTPLPKEFLLPLAAKINAIPLPILPESYGIRLPPERERLTAINWDFLPVRERRTYTDGTADNGGYVDAEASTSMAGAGANSTNMSGMDVDLSATDFLGNSRSAGNEDDEDDDEDMEEIAPQIHTNNDGRVASADASAAEEDADAEADDSERDADADDTAATSNRHEDDDYDAP